MLLGHGILGRALFSRLGEKELCILIADLQSEPDDIKHLKDFQTDKKFSSPDGFASFLPVN